MPDWANLLIKTGHPEAHSLRALDPPEAYKAVPRRVRGLNGQIRTS
jgi:hypothetical protein